jgi:spermidine synthase
MHRVLKPDGTLVINIFGALSGEDEFFTTSLTRTLGAVFKNVRVHQSGQGNTFLVASDQEPLTLRQKPDMARIHPSVRRKVEQTFAHILPVNLARGMVLTDDYNPVEFYDARNREKLRRSLAIQMQSE